MPVRCRPCVLVVRFDDRPGMLDVPLPHPRPRRRRPDGDGRPWRPVSEPHRTPAALVTTAVAKTVAGGPQLLDSHAMKTDALGRRAFLSNVAVLALSFDALAAANGKAAYDPAARFDLDVTETELRRTAAGRTLMARIYQPKGAGPFPVVLDLHGGAWNAKDRFAEEPMDRALAASGLLVVAIDMTLAPEAPVPGVRAGRQLSPCGGSRRRPRRGRATPSKVGVYGSSSGGHVAELLGHAPARPALRRDSAAGGGECRRDDRLRRDAVADQQPLRALRERGDAQARRRWSRTTRSSSNPWETIHESNPQEILERHEPVTPGAAADHAGRARRQRAAGGAGDSSPRRTRRPAATVEFHAVRRLRARVGREARPQTDRAREMVKAFIARS